MKRIGFGQVEPNHLCSKKWSNLCIPADIKVLEKWYVVKI